MPVPEHLLIEQGWGEFPLEIFCYALGVGFLYLLVYVVAGLAVCATYSPKWHLAGRKIARLSVFMGLLLMVSTFFDAVWYLLVWGRLYLSLDPFCEFIPFIPVTQGHVEAPWAGNHGHLLGNTTYVELYFVWVLFAFATWGATIFLHRSFFRIYGRKPVQT